MTKAYQIFLMYEGWTRVSLLQSHSHSKLAPIRSKPPCPKRSWLPLLGARLW